MQRRRLRLGVLERINAVVRDVLVVVDRHGLARVARVVGCRRARHRRRRVRSARTRKVRSHRRIRRGRSGLLLRHEHRHHVAHDARSAAAQHICEQVERSGCRWPAATRRAREHAAEEFQQCCTGFHDRPRRRIRKAWHRIVFEESAEDVAYLAEVGLLTLAATSERLVR
jgi:hypothetical protein